MQTPALPTLKPPPQTVPPPEEQEGGLAPVNMRINEGRLARIRSSASAVCNKPLSTQEGRRSGTRSLEYALAVTPTHRSIWTQRVYYTDPA